MATILVIEDNPDNMDLIEEILEDEGHGVLKATLAEDGIAALRHSGADLVLMDIALPQMSGLEATRIIKDDDAMRQTPVIALTAHAMATDRETALAAGCDAYVTKPIDEAALLHAIHRFLRTDVPSEGQPHANHSRRG